MTRIGIPLFMLLLLTFLFSGAKKEKMPEEQVISFVLANLSHPETAEFRNLEGPCGEVRYRDFFHRDSGFKRFVATSGSDVIIEIADPDREFQRAWARSC